MKLLQRRTTHRSLATNALSARVNNYQNALWSRWQVLSSRDQMALVILLVFLLLFVGGYGGYSVHQAAKESKSNYQEQVADYFWLRSQAANIDPNALNAASNQDGADAMPPASRVNTALNSSGIDNAQVVANGAGVQLSFSHPSQATVSAALGKLEQQGWQFTKLLMQQDVATKQVQVQATVTS
ncbi:MULTISPECIES: type II secretion system protein GspM [unclassified Psychrobacter]|uniref:type II secretion system protein GspM n=1 Tax=unclassified Psychrobacter TaxID=196806 RepID=UPI003F45F42B